MERPARPETLDLHAWVDVRLPPQRRAGVAAWCEAHPAQSARLAAWSRDAAELRESFDPVLEEGLPSSLLPHRGAGLQAPAAPVRSRRPALARWQTCRGLATVAAASFCLGGATALTVANFVARWGGGGAWPPGGWLRSLAALLP